MTAPSEPARGRAQPARCSIETWRWPMATLGGPSTLPRYRWQQPIKAVSTPPNRGLRPEEEALAFTWGADSILPYPVYEDYDRALQLRNIDVVTLDNGVARVVIAPSLGGRVLSYRILADDRELLFSNPVFQPANLSSINAWFSGGIEWNGLIPGHTPVGCDRIFAARIDTPEGPIVRLFDFDRVCEAAWQVDLFLPPGSDRLFVCGTLRNASAVAKDVYWWTNIAAAMRPGLRVIAPADDAIEHVLPGNELERRNFPLRGGQDLSYPAAWTDATSVFFRGGSAPQGFVAAVDSNGCGLVHVTDAALPGRKFFFFGTGAGGQQWMDFLSRPGEGNYIEIQAGITPTQNQRHRLPPHSTLQWHAIIGPVQMAAEDAQAPYDAAVGALQRALAGRYDGAEVVAAQALMAHAAQAAPAAMLQRGRSWGHLHCTLTGEAFGPAMPFSVSSSEPHDFFACVAKGHELTKDVALDWDDRIVVSQAWTDALRRHAETHGATWMHHALLSIAALDKGDEDEALQQAQAGLALRAHWVLLRQAALAGPLALRRTIYQRACQQSDAPLALHLEFASLLVGENDWDAISTVIGTLPPSLRNHERFVLLQAQHTARRRDWPSLRALLDRPFATIREGETLTSDLWTALITGELATRLWRVPSATEIATALAADPVPKHLDFRMHAREGQ